MEDIFMKALRPRINKEIEAAVGAAVEATARDTTTVTSIKIARNMCGVGLDIDTIARVVDHPVSAVCTWLETPVMEHLPA